MVFMPTDLQSLRVLFAKAFQANFMVAKVPAGAYCKQLQPVLAMFWSIPGHHRWVLDNVSMRTMSG